MITNEDTFATTGRFHPWHTMGERLERSLTIDEALERVGADDEVTHITLYDSDGEEVPSHLGIKSSKYGNMWVSRPGYEISQRREILELAYQIQGLSKDKAHVDTIGNLGPKAEQFFAYLRFKDLVIDPKGIADQIERGLYCATSYNLTLQNTIGYSNLRLACMNQLAMTLRRGLNQAITARHTRNWSDRIKEAAIALDYAGAIEEQVVRKAEEMLRVDGDRAMYKVLDHFWDVSDGDLLEKSRTRRLNTRNQIWNLYEGADNTASNMVGRNGYGAYQAITEYFDHERVVQKAKGEQGNLTRAKSAVLPGRTVDQKIKASSIILELV